MTKLKIKVDRTVLERSKLCGRVTDKNDITGTNCAISLAVRDIWPNAYVSDSFINTDVDLVPIKYTTGNFLLTANRGISIGLPKEASDFIKSFDSLMPAARLRMPELEFEIEIPDSELEKLVNLDEIKETLKNHPNLELCSMD